MQPIIPRAFHRRERLAKSGATPPVFIQQNTLLKYRGFSNGETQSSLFTAVETYFDSVAGCSPIAITAPATVFAPAHPLPLEFFLPVK